MWILSPPHYSNKHHTHYTTHTTHLTTHTLHHTHTHTHTTAPHITLHTHYTTHFTHTHAPTHLTLVFIIMWWEKNPHVGLQVWASCFFPLSFW